MNKQNRGTSLDAFYKRKRPASKIKCWPSTMVAVWELTEAVQKQSLSTARLAELRGTGRHPADRLLDPTRDITLFALQRNAAFVGKKVQIEWV